MIGPVLFYYLLTIASLSIHYQLTIGFSPPSRMFTPQLIEVYNKLKAIAAQYEQFGSRAKTCILQLKQHEVKGTLDSEEAERLREELRNAEHQQSVLGPNYHPWEIIFVSE